MHTSTFKALAAALVSGLTVTTALLTAGIPTAQAATLQGYDISWPQCPTAQGGSGLPLPPTSAQFVVVGLTDGLPFTENPCLAAQVSWAATNRVPAQGYTMAAFPTPAQFTAYRSQGPWAASTRPGQLSNIGYAEASFAAASMKRIGFKPPMVWIDVEPRTAQPWPVTGAAAQQENRYVVEGLMRGLRDAGYSYGLYSFTSGWQAITASWRLPGVPVWATAGRLDYPNEALDQCAKPGFSGGHVYLAQWYDDTRDYDLNCGSYAFTALSMPASTLSNSTADFTGDWNNDVLARLASDASLRLYPGTGRGSFGASATIGNGWAGFNALETVGDFNGDGSLDVLAKQSSTGYLWLYPGNGKGAWLPPVRVGNGWNAFNAIIGVGDFNGDQRVDVLARETATGRLWLYPGNGTGGWLPRVVIGAGWNGFNAIVGTGDFNGDGRTDVLARETSTGFLWLYPGNGTGGWFPHVLVGNGWNTLTSLMSPGDFNSDRTSDVLARDAAGRLWLYPGSGTGGWLARQQVGAGWNAINSIF
ncbi:MAG: FG-GAP-like repeat-containing protein [Specibacter sp.]